MKKCVQNVGLLMLLIIMATCLTASVSASCALSRNTVPAARPEYSTLTITEPGRYSLRLESQTGASVQLIDRIRGPAETSGIPGVADGRLDVFLDPGSYQLLVTGSGLAGEQVTITASGFTRAQRERVSLAETEILEGELNDLEILEYWFTVGSNQPVYIDAAGRSLEDMRIWFDGVWLSEHEPRRSVSESTPGRPLNRRQLFVTCPPGTHKVSVYGGQPGIWAAGGETMPFFIRSGFSSMPPAGSISRNISVFGEDIYQIEPGANYIRLAASTLGTGFSVEEVNPYEDLVLRSPFVYTIRDLARPYTDRFMYNSDSKKIIRVSGSKGSLYNLKWFQVNTSNPRLMTLNTTSDVTFFHGGNPADTPELNVVIVEESRKSPRGENVIAHAAIRVDSQSPVYRRFNVSEPVSLFLEFAQDGTCRFSARGTPARFILEPFFVRPPENYSRPLPKSFPSSVSVGAKLYRMTIEPDKPGLMELVISTDVTEPEWSKIPPVSADSGESVVFRQISFTNQKQYQFVTNDVNVRTGFFVGRAAENDEPDQVVFCPEDADKIAAKNEAQRAFPELRPGKQLRLLKESSVTAQARMVVLQDGQYDISTRSRFAHSIRLRGAMRTNLAGFNIENSPGNAGIRQFLTQGEYYLDVVAAPRSSGQVLVTCTALNEVFNGQLTVGDLCRSHVSDLQYATAEVVISDPGRYTFSSYNPDAPGMLRLETGDGWPIAVATTEIPALDLVAGRYRLMQFLLPSIRKNHLRVRDADVPPPARGEGPFQLNLSGQSRGLWEDREQDSEGDVWTFDLQADTEVTLSLSPGMNGRLVDAVSVDTVAVVPDTSFWKGDLPAGRWGLLAESTLPDNEKPYSIHLEADPLVSGTVRSVKCPGSVDLRIGSLEPQFVILTVDSIADTRAVLADAGGRVIAISDDIPGDWNPYFAMWLLPGEYTLYVTQIVGNTAEAIVSLNIPAMRMVEWPASGDLTIAPNDDVIFLKPDIDDRSYVSAVMVSSNGLNGISGVPEPDGQAIHQVFSQHGTEQIMFFPPDYGQGCIVWSVDGRAEPLHLVKTAIPVTASAISGKTIPVKWVERELGSHTVSAAAIECDSPGSFRFDLALQMHGIVVSTDSKPFIPMHCEQPDCVVVPAQKHMFIACVCEKGRKAPGGSLKRMFLEPGSEHVKWQRGFYDEVWIDLALNNADFSVVTVTAQTECLPLGLDGVWTPERLAMPLNASSDQWSYVMDHGKYKRLGLRFNCKPDMSGAIAAESTEPVQIAPALTLTSFNPDTAAHFETPVGTHWIPARSMAIVTGNDGCHAENGVVIHHEKERDSGRWYLLNTLDRPAGVSWNTTGKQMTLPSRLQVSDGQATEVFLAPGVNQLYTFSLDRPDHIGVSVTTTSGQIDMRLLDPFGVEIASGLLINEALDPGDYTLMVSNPPGGPPARVQPFFVIKTPDRVMRFGTEE